MLTLFYSPHAASTDNEAGRASGHANVPLSPRGRQKAAAMAEHYATKHIDLVFCSDLQRASTTAEMIFAGRDLPIIRDVRLREFNYGDLTQTPRDLLKLERYLTAPFPNGESVTAAVRRTVDFVDEMRQTHDGKTIVVIAHSASLYALEYLSGNDSLAQIVTKPREWLDVPIWRYEFGALLRSL